MIILAKFPLNLRYIYIYIYFQINFEDFDIIMRVGSIPVLLQLISLSMKF